MIAKGKNRIGQTNLHKKSGQLMTIIGYQDSLNISVQFEDGTVLHHVSYQSFKRGSTRKPGLQYYGVPGAIGPKWGEGKTKAGRTWTNIMNKCFGPLSKKPAYRGCIICDEWKNHDNFKKWFDKNYYVVDGEKMDLDKDILEPYCGVKLYSPETCLFVPSRINSTVRAGKKGKETGIIEYPNSFTAYIRNDGERINLGNFPTKEEALAVYKAAKETMVHNLVELYGNKLPEEVRQALLRWEYVPREKYRR